MERIFARIEDTLAAEKRNINQFYLSAGHSITELHKMDAYVEQLRAIVNRLHQFLAIYEHLKKTTPLPKLKTKQYAQLINQISVEYHYLIAVNQAMEENLRETGKTVALEMEISGKMLDLKKEINKTIKEVANILRL